MLSAQVPVVGYMYIFIVQARSLMSGISRDLYEGNTVFRTDVGCKSCLVTQLLNSILHGGQRTHEIGCGGQHEAACCACHQGHRRR